jgi:hypothetical protein
MRKFFSRITAAGSFGAVIITYITAGWGVLMSAALSILVLASASLTSWIETPAVHSAGFAFIFSLWTIIGVLFLYDRSRPRLVSPAADYRYGLTLEQIGVLFYPRDDNCLQFTLMLRNVSPGPVHYDVDMFDIRITSRVSPKIKRGDLSAYMARGAMRGANMTPFRRSDIIEFYGRSVMGTLDFIVKYGAPDEDPVRQLTMSWTIFLQFPNADAIAAQPPNGTPMQIGFNSIIVSEKDEPVSTA